MNKREKWKQPQEGKNYSDQFSFSYVSERFVLSKVISRKSYLESIEVLIKE